MILPMSQWTPDIWVYAVAVTICATVFAVCLIAAVDAPAPGSRPAARHRRRMSYSEVSDMFREMLYTAGYWALGLYLLAAAAFPLVMRGLHWKDGWRQNRFYKSEAAN